MLLSVVIPCYNEADNLDELHRQLDAVATTLWAEPGRAGDDVQVEFVFVNDGSRDATLEKLRALAGKDDRVRALDLSRNFGHQAALSAGVDHARGDAVVVMDADLQHPPELIPELVSKWRAGYDLIYAYREGVRPRFGYRVINALMKVHIPAESADFRLMDRRVVDAFRRMPERARFIRGMISWLGFRQAGVGYHEHERFAGSRAYSLRQTARMTLNAVLAFSSIPLRMASILGLFTLGMGVVYAVYILSSMVSGRELQPGWPSLIMAILVLGGVQLLCLGVLAEYIGRIFEEVKQRPLYVVREWIGPPADAGPPQENRLGAAATGPVSRHAGAGPVDEPAP